MQRKVMQTTKYHTQPKSGLATFYGIGYVNALCIITALYLSHMNNCVNFFSQITGMFT